MLKGMVLAVVVIIVALLSYAATRPDRFMVERKTVIRAAPAAIFPLIDDFHRWLDWSPYERIDPTVTRDFSGASRGQGAVYAWNGNRKVGQGRMEITQSMPASKVLIQLDVVRPLAGHNVAEFTLEPGPDGTTVQWAMRGPSPYVAKVMGIFIDMDHMIGKDFEQGLANLKVEAEK